MTLCIKTEMAGTCVAGRSEAFLSLHFFVTKLGLTILCTDSSVRLTSQRKIGYSDPFTLKKLSLVYTQSLNSAHLPHFKKFQSLITQIVKY